MRKLRFVIVGSGYRSLYFARIAKALPEHFELCAMLCRTKEKAEHMTETYGVPVSISEEECLAMKPDFAVVVVNKTSICEVTKRWAGFGVPVLCETPAALTLPELDELWKLKTEKGARIQVAEQYTRQAVHTAQLKVLEKGYLGDPYNISLSMAHDYHGASLIRHYLGIGLEQVTLWGKKYVYPVIATDSRSGPVTDGSVVNAERMHAVFEFEGGKTAYYDFSGIQYRSFIRTRQINVQGLKGELDDLTLRYVNENNLPECSSFEIIPSENPKGIAKIRWNGETVYENPYPGSGLTEDETAIAELMAGMADYIDTGKEVYPLAEALQDAYMLILMEQAAERPFEKVQSEKQSWMEG